MAKVSYVFFFAAAVIIMILSTVLLIFALKSKWIIKSMAFIIFIFILVSVYVIKDIYSPEGYSTIFDNEDKQEYISGKIVDKKTHDFMFNDNSEHYIKVQTKKDLFPEKVIVKKNEYESLSENESFKAKVGVLMRPNGSEPIAR
uniref:hypothetical protein n=1 Tax=Staphylococcus shinii TaxID=2912228 RepID=UPI003F5651D2